MGQYLNQPDFITHDIKIATPIPSASITSDNSLRGSVIYIGTSTNNEGNIQLIPAGSVGPSVVTGFSSPGYTGSRGSGYGDVVDQPADFIGGSGNLPFQVLYTAVNGQVVSIKVGPADRPGSDGYKNGDLITIDAGDVNAVFRIEAVAGLPTSADAITFQNVLQGTWFPVIVDYVISDGTTVSNLMSGK